MTPYQYMTLPDGRKLSYLEFGNKDGHPVFYFHGAPSSCLEPLVIGEDLFGKYGIRIISPNRPGIGPSDFQPNRTFSDWPADVIALANHLGVEKFSVFGNSGGGGYVVACASSIPERLLSAAVISGGWQMNMPETKKHLKFPYSMFWFVASNLPFLLPLLLGTMKSNPKESREKAFAQAKKMMASADYEVLIQGNRAEMLSKAMDEALTDKKGVAWDLKMYAKKMDISLEQISFPIIFFHGEQDKNLPIQVAQKMVAKMPNAKLVTFKEEAHLSCLCNHFTDAAAVLIKR
ncbi:MAG: alpha/beta hydrolase [Bacteroidota bacterium]|nr:alpha/beta hydrolase [Bacteroidota bacterium]